MLPQTAQSRTFASPILLASSWGVGCFLVALVNDVLALYQHATAPWVVGDGLLLGMIAGGLVFRYEMRRARYLRERLKTIDETNHHVRNALQTISLAAHLQDEGLARTVRESSQRIDWALREVLGSKKTV